MHRIALAIVAFTFMAMPSGAAVLGYKDVALLTTAATYRPSITAAFSFTFDARKAAAFDISPYSVQTFGTGQTSAFGGFLGIPLTPSLFDTWGITIDANLFPSYASFRDPSPIPYSLVPGDLALRYAVGRDYFYGYSRFNGDGTFDIAFESRPNTAIIGGAAVSGPLAPVPEPATWAMMVGGFGLVGGAMRRRPRGSNRTA